MNLKDDSIIYEFENEITKDDLHGIKGFIEDLGIEEIAINAKSKDLYKIFRRFKDDIHKWILICNNKCIELLTEEDSD